jgi:hypothetical protein
MRGERFGAAGIAFSQLDSGRSERTRQLGPLEESAAGGDEDSQIAATDSLEGFDTLARYLGVGFGLAKALAGRVESDTFGFDEGTKVSEPSLRARNIVTDQDVESAREVLSEAGEDHCVAGSVKPPHPAALGLTRQIGRQLAKFGKRFDNREQLRERHGAR